MKKLKTKKRNYFSIAVCKAWDIDVYHVSVMDMDTQKILSGTVFRCSTSAFGADREIKMMIGKFVLELMRFKI